MPLSFTLIDPTNLPLGPFSLATTRVLLKQGSTLWLLLRGFTPSATVPWLYKSTNGSSFTLVNTACPVTPEPTYISTMFFSEDAAGLLQLAYVTRGDITNLIEFTAYDPNSDTWSSVQNIGGGYDPNSTALNGTSGLPAYRIPHVGSHFRPDNTQIVAHQCEIVYSFPTIYPYSWPQVRFLKQSGGTWTELALLAATPDVEGYTIQNSFMTPSGDVYLLASHAVWDIPSDQWLYMQLYLYVISAADDSVHGPYLIDNDTEDQYPTYPFSPGSSGDFVSGWQGRPALSSDGSILAFGYGYQLVTKFQSSPGAADLKVVLLDISTTPLSPTITVETAGAGAFAIDNQMGSCDFALSYSGGLALSAYWIPTETSYNPVGGVIASVVKSTRTAPGVWNAPTVQWLGTVVNPASGNLDSQDPALQGIDVLELGAGIDGIALQVIQSVAPYELALYNGPFGSVGSYILSQHSFMLS